MMSDTMVASFANEPPRHRHWNAIQVLQSPLPMAREPERVVPIPTMIGQCHYIRWETRKPLNSLANRRIYPAASATSELRRQPPRPVDRLRWRSPRLTIRGIDQTTQFLLNRQLRQFR